MGLGAQERIRLERTIQGNNQCATLGSIGASQPQRTSTDAAITVQRMPSTPLQHAEQRLIRQQPPRPPSVPPHEGAAGRHASPRCTLQPSAAAPALNRSCKTRLRLSRSLGSGPQFLQMCINCRAPAPASKGHAPERKCTPNADRGLLVLRQLLRPPAGALGRQPLCRPSVPFRARDPQPPAVAAALGGSGRMLQRQLRRLVSVLRFLQICKNTCGRRWAPAAAPRAAPAPEHSRALKQGH